MTDFPKFDEKISENLKKGSQACYKNGNDLLFDASILFDRERYARATSLAILAEEEFSKAMILQLSSNNGRWDKDLYEALRKHEKKQAVSGALIEVMDAFANHYSRSKFLFIPLIFDFEQHAQKAAAKVKIQYVDKKNRDKRKQDAQFVAIGRTGIACRIPTSFTRKDAAAENDRAVRFRAYLDALYQKLGDDFPLFRGATTVEYCGGITSIKHKSGVTIRMEPFAWAQSGEGPNNENMNPYLFISKNNIFEIDKLGEEQKANLARIYKCYSTPDQIRAEMQKLGLRSTDYLDEVEGLIRKYVK